jgi:hypothetical protein
LVFLDENLLRTIRLRKYRNIDFPGASFAGITFRENCLWEHLTRLVLVLAVEKWRRLVFKEKATKIGKWRRLVHFKKLSSILKISDS